MMGLIDANNFENAIKALESFKQKEDVLKLLGMMKTIDPEDLPIVKELRE